MSTGTAFFLRFYDLGRRGGAAFFSLQHLAFHGWKAALSRVSMSSPSATSRKPIHELLSEAKSEISYAPCTTTFTTCFHMFSCFDGKSCVFLHLLHM
jgi:hypothetical protein